MKFRRTLKTDVTDIMKVIAQAQAYLKEQGVDQWQCGYPNVEVINSDIDNGYGYVLLKDDDIVATVAVAFDGEKTYDTIYDGKWITNGEYAVIHRIAVESSLKGSGISSQIIKNIENLCLDRGVKSIKVDTHEDNLSMQKMLKKNDFKHCGVIYLESGSKRIAFEKAL